MNLWTEIGPLVQFARTRARRGNYNGEVNPQNMRLVRDCGHLFAVNPLVSARLIYTRDVGHHTSGWWKNPLYERCLHLSISFCANPSNAPLSFDKKRAEQIAVAFFEGETRKCWVEPPYSPEGRAYDVHHYRLFCDPSWTPILPRGEVYSRDMTPAHWKSFSEIHGWTPMEKDAPFLKSASD